VKSHSWEIKGYESYISKLFKGSSLGEGGCTFEERLREGEVACIPMKFLYLEGKSFSIQKLAHIPRKIDTHF
jgi:hypothetical protein